MALWKADSNHVVVFISDITKDKKLQIVVREDDMTLNARLVVDGLAASTGAQ